jgi:hypothetical protein
VKHRPFPGLLIPLLPFVFSKRQKIVVEQPGGEQLQKAAGWTDSFTIFADGIQIALPCLIFKKCH